MRIPFETGYPLFIWLCGQKKYKFQIKGLGGADTLPLQPQQPKHGRKHEQEL